MRPVAAFRAILLAYVVAACGSATATPIPLRVGFPDAAAFAEIRSLIDDVFGGLIEAGVEEDDVTFRDQASGIRIVFRGPIAGCGRRFCFLIPEL